MNTEDNSLSKTGMESALKIVALDIGDDLKEVHENFIKTAKILRIITAELKDGITTAGDQNIYEYLDNSLIPLMKLERELSEIVENYNDIFAGFMRVAMPRNTVPKAGAEQLITEDGS